MRRQGYLTRAKKGGHHLGQPQKHQSRQLCRMFEDPTHSIGSGVA